MREIREKLFNDINTRNYLFILIMILPLITGLLYYYPSYLKIKELRIENQRLEGKVYSFNQHLSTWNNNEEELAELQETLKEMEQYTYCGSQLDEVFIMMEEVLLFKNFLDQEVELEGIVFSQDSSYGFIIMDISFMGSKDDLLSYIKYLEDNHPGLTVEDLRFHKEISIIHGNLRVKGTLCF